MKAKDVAAAVNQAAEAEGILAQWEDVKRRMVAGEPDEALQPATRALVAAALRVTREPAQDYLTFLTKDLGRQLAGLHGGGRGKPESLRAAVRAADQAWRGFHGRLNPASRHVLDIGALQHALRTTFPLVHRLGWGEG